MMRWRQWKARRVGLKVSAEEAPTAARWRSADRYSWRIGAAWIVALLLAVDCAHRYSEDRRDWAGPRDGDFEADFADCKRRMDDAPFRYGGDPRLLFLDCMEKRGWYLKDRS